MRPARTKVPTGISARRHASVRRALAELVRKGLIEEIFDFEHGTTRYSPRPRKAGAR